MAGPRRSPLLRTLRRLLAIAAGAATVAAARDWAIRRNDAGASHPPERHEPH